MKRVNRILIVLFCGLLAACSDFLEEKAQDEVRVKSVQDFSELLLFYTDRGNGSVYALTSLVEFLTDDVELNNYSNGAKLQTYFEYLTWQPTAGMKNLDLAYEKLYTYIMGANCVLDGIDGATGGTVEQKELIKAKALALRAENYFMLVNLYGEPYNHNKKALGVPLKLDASLLENGIARSTVEEVYNQMIKDLTQAIELFKKYEKKRDQGMNITSSYILLSRIYLYMEEWTKAAQMATNAIETSLGLTDYTAITSFKPSYTFSEVEYINHTSYNSELFAGTFLFLSQDFMALFENTDQRRSFWLEVATPQIPTSKKWKTAGDYRMYQTAMSISEAYLNRMEAYLLQEQPNVQGALDDLNLLRRNRIKNYEDVSISDPQVLLEEIRTERRKELCFDGHRWFDLRRYGMPAMTRGYREKKTDPFQYYTLKEKDPLYTLPIPEKAFENNPKLVQNPCVDEPMREPDAE